MTSHHTLSAQAGCWFPERGAGCRRCTEGASLLSFFFFFFFYLCLFLRSTSLKTLLLHSLPDSLSPKLPLKHPPVTPTPPPFFHSTTKHFIQTNLPASLLQTSTQYKPQETNENTKNECKPK